MSEEEKQFNNRKKSRVSYHNHITGLGLDNETGEASKVSGGFIGQEKAREAAGIISNVIKSKKMAGRAVLFVGPPSTGKTAIALGIACELGNKIPFCSISGSEIYSSEVKKTEMLMQYLRRSIGIRIKETKEFYEGEVMEINTVHEIESNKNSPITQVILKMKTTRSMKQLTFLPAMYDAIEREHIQVRDVIHIEANSLAIKRVGKCDAYAGEFDLEVQTFVPLPKGDVCKRREVVHDVTLHDLDVAHARSGCDDGGAISMIRQIVKMCKTEMTGHLRRDVNAMVDKYVEQGVAELIPGVLFIDEVHLLDIEAFSYLHNALESPVAPTVILATNRGLALVRGTDDMYCAHGIPTDMLNRVLIVRTQRYDREETKEILKLRLEAEDVRFSVKALRKLVDISVNITLRYAIQLITPSSILADHRGRKVVIERDLLAASRQFLDGNVTLRTANDDNHGSVMSRMSHSI